MATLYREYFQRMTEIFVTFLGIVRYKGKEGEMDL
jgi:hypothetical protein